MRMAKSLSAGLLSYLHRAAIGRPTPSQCSRLRDLHFTHQPKATPNSNTFSRPTTLRKVQPFPTRPTKRTSSNPADDPNWISLVDVPRQIVRHRPKHNRLGLAVLAIIPLTAFALGTWQVQRLGWKSDLIARFEDRLVRPPLPLPPSIDPSVIGDFDYRRVYAWGRYRHDQEVLVGPRVHDGEDGYQVITPLEREGEEGGGTKILVARGWIAKGFKDKNVRMKVGGEGLPQGRVKVQGLLREPFKKNLFTPDNAPEKGRWYFPDVKQMAEYTGSTPVWIEETMSPDLMTAWDRGAKGVPIGRPAEVNLRNNHTQYIFTWYALSFATTIMFYMVVKKPASNIANRVRQSRQW